MIVVDENLGPRAAEILALCYKDIDITSINRLNLRGTEDPVLAKKFSSYQPRPVFMCCDWKILKKPVERAEFINAGVPLVLIGTSWMNRVPFAERLWRLVKLWPRIQKELDGGTGHFFITADVFTQRVDTGLID